jgi:nucleotide-binding universal stress UspA family protein
LIQINVNALPIGTTFVQALSIELYAVKNADGRAAVYKRILVPIDGSDASGLALREAIALAKDQNATIRIFHVVDLTTTYSSVSSPHVVERQNALQAEGQKVVANGSEPVRAMGIQCDSKCISTFNKDICDLIENEANHWPADVIVIGTHGRRGIRRMFLGSVAEGLARISNKPLLLIRGAPGANKKLGLISGVETVSDRS